MRFLTGLSVCLNCVSLIPFLDSDNFWGTRQDRSLDSPEATVSPAIVSRSINYAMEAFMQSVTFKVGETIIREGDEGATAFFIVTGSVDVCIGEGNRTKTVGALGPGEVFGEMCLIEPGPRSATIKATTDVECLAASYEEFIAAIEDYPERAVGFMKTLVRRLRQMNDLLENASPERRGLRGVIRELQKCAEPSKLDPEVAALSWTMLW
jgi:CRP/FNR family transcriptional regulator, cyclic AMP receptor protein